LLAAFGLPAVAPALTLGQDAEASLSRLLPPQRRASLQHERCIGRPALHLHFLSAAPAFRTFITPGKISSFALLSAPRLTIQARSTLLACKPSATLHSSTHDFALYSAASLASPLINFDQPRRSISNCACCLAPSVSLIAYPCSLTHPQE